MLKEILLLEYEKVKDEQRARIAIRENLFYTTLIVVGAAFSALLTMRGFDVGYLALTPVLFIISNAYYYNDEIISRMNLYVRESLSRRLAAATGLSASELFQWESFTRHNRRVRRRVYQFVANLVLYPGASGASLFFFVSRRAEFTQAERIGVLICALATALMLIQVLYYADLFSGRRD
jgi:hypothetical protein